MKIALLFVAALWAPICLAQDNVRWLNDYEQARQASRDSGKPMLVQFRCEA